MKVALGIEYDGQKFCGWQRQPHSPSVQARLEKAIQIFLDRPARCVCAGRTDTGVHATQQVVHVDTPIIRGSRNWVRGVNSHLPPRIAVLWAERVDQDFHARYSATARTYRYWIYNHAIRSPIYEGRAGWVWRPMNVDVMRQASRCLLGRHDFTSFRAAECQANSPIRTIRALDIVQQGRLIGIRIRANAFLHHMVRNIVGSLVYVAIGREKPEWLAWVLAQRSRAVAAPTFSPAGLYLTGVRYPGAPWSECGMSPFGGNFPTE